MRYCEPDRDRPSRPNFRLGRVLPLIVVLCAAPVTFAQAGVRARQSSPNLARQMQMLNLAMARAQAQLEQSQRQLDALRGQLRALQRQVAAGSIAATPPTSVQTGAVAAESAPDGVSKAIADLRERQQVQATQIATQEQAKVESASRYPVQLTGLVLFNGFVNTGGVDMAATPTIAAPGAGSTGASMRQTILGINARGPHWLGASSSADLRVDFNGNVAAGTSAPADAGYANAGATLLRLRTAHARLQWEHTEVYVALDRPLLSPDTPTSLTAVAEPALAWSGNLWTWNPQVGITEDTGSPDGDGFRLQAALMDVADAPLAPPAGVPARTPPSSAQSSRWPGVEGRIEFHGPVADNSQDRDHIGVGGYFARHYSSLLGQGYQSWAGTLDARLLLPAGLEWTGSFYRGQALGGLGGGAFKDVSFGSDGTDYYFRPLDAVGGWAQLKEKVSERLQLNAAFGMDDAFAHELRPFAVIGGSAYQNLTRNRTLSGNVIFSPSAYLQFSLEYRYLKSYEILGPSAVSHVIGLGAGYKF